MMRLDRTVIRKHAGLLLLALVVGCRTTENSPQRVATPADPIVLEYAPGSEKDRDRIRGGPSSKSPIPMIASQFDPPLPPGLLDSPGDPAPPVAAAPPGSVVAAEP